MCSVVHVKEPRTLIVKEKGLGPVFLDSRLEHPAGWICARYKSYHYYHYKTVTGYCGIIIILLCLLTFRGLQMYVLFQIFQIVPSH